MAFPSGGGATSRPAPAAAAKPAGNYRVVSGNTSAVAAALNPNSAAGQAQAVLGPQLAQQDLYAAHQNAVIQSFARSLLGQLQPIAGQVGSDYDKAIQQIKGLSGQASQYFSGQNPTASQQALGDAVGAPQEQQAQQAAQLGNTFQGGAGVLQYTGGTIPGSELAGNKAAAMAQARTLPAIGALKGQQDLASALWQQSQNRMTLEATRPGLVQTAQQQINDTNYRNATLAQSAAAARERTREFDIGQANAAAAARATSAYRQSQLDLGYAKAKQSAYDKAADRKATAAYHDSYLTYLQNGASERVAHDKALEAAAATRNQIAQQSANNAATKANNASAPKYSASVSRSLGRRSDQYGNPIGGGAVLPGFKRTKSGAIVKTGTSSGAAPKLSAEGLQRATAAISDGLEKAYNGFTAAKEIDPATGKLKVFPAVSRDEALAELRAAGWLATPQLARIAMAALNRRYKALEAAGAQLRGALRSAGAP